MSTCPHLWEAREVAPIALGCRECIATGDTWVHLRLCLTCGNVACCDQSKNRHASAHFAATGHPVARSQQPGEAWRWCYAHEVMDDPDELEMEGADLG
ncbi:MAG TPA: UBP-type zinc finger domain-containing protein [Candidatus Limnocylindrales bacterium]|nr:UBP-type zinc finger domain-containing protein [Candidatus Limnocylindrales bacterium]